MGSFSDFGQHQLIRFNEDNSLKLSIPSNHFSQTQYVHTGIKEATNSTRLCDEFEKEEACVRRNLTASKIMIANESNWQLTSAPLGQRSPMYCQSEYYSFDGNGYCRSDFTPFIKGTYMACHKAVNMWRNYFAASGVCEYHIGKNTSLAEDGWNYHLGIIYFPDRRIFFRETKTVWEDTFDFYFSLWDKTYSPGPPGRCIALTKNKLLVNVETPRINIATPGMRPGTQIQAFSGAPSEHLFSFLRSFNDQAKPIKPELWDEDEKNFLLTYLTETARDRAEEQMETRTDTTFEELCDYLKSRYEEVSRQQLRNCQQNIGESVDEFASSISKLASASHCNQPRELITAKALEAFLDGLCDYLKSLFS
ncbi:unnamed protein product [Caenorhabditis bovis]|uniref:Uncharacterized protein n=1 Tax=Caenorhabditis bovis TaxID=2654633 RepID=A0A8S1FF14_9PELO|nr:unnamed protein product [Caenorhabditis bovis]